MKYVSKIFEWKPVKRVLDWLATETWLSTMNLHGECTDTGHKIESTEVLPLNNGTLRYKRNILALSAGVLAWWWFEDAITVEKIQSFGIAIKKEASLKIIILLLGYNTINYFWRAYSDWCTWAAELRSATYDYLRMNFRVWPDVSVLRLRKWQSLYDAGEFRRIRDVQEGSGGPFIRFRITRMNVNNNLFHARAPIARVNRARNRILQFFLLDVALPAAAMIAAVLIIFSQLNSAEAAETQVTERNQALQYRYLQVWPSETR